MVRKIVSRIVIVFGRLFFIRFDGTRKTAGAVFVSLR